MEGQSSAGSTQYSYQPAQWCDSFGARLQTCPAATSSTTWRESYSFLRIFKGHRERERLMLHFREDDLLATRTQYSERLVHCCLQVLFLISLKLYLLTSMPLLRNQPTSCTHTHLLRRNFVLATSVSARHLDPFNAACQNSTERILSTFSSQDQGCYRRVCSGSPRPDPRKIGMFIYEENTMVLDEAASKQVLGQTLWNYHAILMNKWLSPLLDDLISSAVPDFPGRRAIPPTWSQKYVFHPCTKNENVHTVHCLLCTC